MLAYILALVVGLSSVALYMAAFFFPEVHRKHDFLWSGLGLFYALVLWVCAGRITGGVLLGQTASVTLLGWLGWQTLALRRQVAPVDQQTAVPTPAEWQAALSQTWVGLLNAKSIAPIAQPIGKQVAKLTAWLEALVTTTTTPKKTSPSTVEPPLYVPLTPADFANASQTPIAPSKTIASEVTPVQTGATAQPKESPLTAIAKQVQGSFKGLTAKRESKPVYVRKQFRAPEAEVQAVGNVSGTKTSSDSVPESMAPELPTLETIEVTIADVAADSLASPSSTVEADSVSESEKSP